MKIKVVLTSFATFNYSWKNVWNIAQQRAQNKHLRNDRCYCYRHHHRHHCSSHPCLRGESGGSRKLFSSPGGCKFPPLPHVWLSLTSPKVCPRVFCGESKPKVELRVARCFQVLNPLPSFKGSATLVTLCRTRRFWDPTGVGVGDLPARKENFPIWVATERPCKPFVNVCWTALGWVQRQPWLYIISLGAPS